ncbi:MAG: HAD-IIIC family phosphatase, partial [Planctomycetota bacterium]
QRLWYSSRYPFSPKGGNLLVERLMRFPILERTPKVKCIVLDCDNTLWGGIIGEDGMAGIALGPEYPGNCFVAFQRRLLDMLNRGCLLAICSKNNLHDVQQVIREHPSMVLREENFAAILANWDPKPDNLSLLAEELSLGLDSFLFVDDSPHECRMVRNVLPEMRVVQVPEQPLEVPFCLDHLQELEILSLTDEDRQRFRMYVHNRRRKELAVTCGDLSDYLNSLKMKMRISVNGAEHVSRLSQMTQKTNQFNLTTKRYSEKDIRSFVDDDNWMVAHFSLSDIFGDNGIVGLMLASDMTSDTVLIDTFLMSCRIIGRRAEEAFLYRMLRSFRELNKLKVKASYIPTSKNSLVEDFWAKQDFIPLGESYYESDLANLPEDHPSLSHFDIRFEEEV